MKPTVNITKLSGPAEEAYKVLWANLCFLGFNKVIKIVSVTSYGPNEGKSTTSFNLAKYAAGTGLKVLYVDADIRKPMLMKHLKSLGFNGLSNYLMGHTTDADEIIYSTELDGFFCVPSGAKPSDPVSLLNSDRFDSFLETVWQEFDMVVIDTPPLGSVIDSSIVAAKTDGVLIVIRPNSVKHKNALMVKEQLDKSGANILGVVLNDVDQKSYRNFYANYDYYGVKRKYAKSWVKNLTAGKRS
ncbi:MAG: Tyrosine-protein kinase CpsD [Firmicutes bacterium ADurb.Bin182]|nr:MAG: Tyrosine-protein kinase CpsD [Firmicutes bacterium ADurb.Bin182]